MNTEYIMYYIKCFFVGIAMMVAWPFTLLSVPILLICTLGEDVLELLGCKPYNDTQEKKI